MTLSRFSGLAAFAIYPLTVFVAAPLLLSAEPTPQATAAFDSYTSAVESRIARQHQSLNGFLATSAVSLQDQTRLRNGELIVERLTPSAGAFLPGGLLHHWRGSAFVKDASVSDFEDLIKSFNDYPHRFYPQVLQARLLAQNGNRLQAVMRVRQRHIIPVVLDTTYDINLSRVDSEHGYTISRSAQISEIASHGTNSERALKPGEEHGFLWKLNTYWSYEERDGGLYLQIESISLTRSIPRGLGWAIRPLAESVPRESLEFTLRSACNALRK